MDSLYILIPIAILFIGGAAKLFFWAVNNEQYDDLETEGRRILFDDDLPQEERRDSGDPLVNHGEDGEC